MTQSAQLNWPAAGSSLTDVVHRLIELANDVQFLEIGLDGSQVARLDAAKDAVREIERALGESIDTDAPSEREAIARRLMGLLHSLADDGLALTATVDRCAVEGAAGVGHLEVLSIVVDRLAQEQRAAA